MPIFMQKLSGYCLPARTFSVLVLGVFSAFLVFLAFLLSYCIFLFFV